MLKKKILQYFWPLVFHFRKLIYPLQIFLFEHRLKRKYKNNNQELILSGLICIFDKKFQHGGLVDKIKGIVSGYYLAKIANIDFYIYFSNPQNPLISIINNSIVNVITDKSQLSFSKKYSTPILWYNYMPRSYRNILRRLKSKNQIHFYCNVNILPVFITESTTFIDKWSNLFHQIFKIDSFYISKSNFIDNKYIGVHFRFMDLFGDFTDLNFSNYTEEYRSLCLEWCINTLQNLVNKYKDYKFLIVSDSKYFLDYCNKISFISVNKDRFIIENRQIGHIYIDQRIEIFEKAVSDFISLSLCNKIFQVRYGKMHNSDFSRYASYVKKVDFELIQC
jgi:hypothetical protein